MRNENQHGEILEAGVSMETHHGMPNNYITDAWRDVPGA